jgi:hypothetical protein
VKKAFYDHIRCETAAARYRSFLLKPATVYAFVGAQKFSFAVEYIPTEGHILQQNTFIFSK